MSPELKPDLLGKTMEAPGTQAFGSRQVDEGLADTLEQMARFRNIIVHQYTQVDAEIVVQVLHNRLTDFARFRDSMVALLKKM